MSKRRITACVVGAVLTVLGIALFAGALAMGGWDINSLSNEVYETNTYAVEAEAFSSIRIDADTADVVFVLSENGECKVVCEERDDMKHSVSAENGTLAVKHVDSRKWYDHIALFSLGMEKITVYLPKTEYESLYITNDTGDIDVPSAFEFESIDIALSTGDVRLSSSVSGDIRIKISTGRISIKDVTCGNLYLVGSTGDVRLENVIAAGVFDIERSTGDVSFESCDAASVKIETDTGDVRGTFLTDKIIHADSDTGRVNVPRSTSGGLCEIETDTGNIIIEIAK